MSIASSNRNSWWQARGETSIRQTGRSPGNVAATERRFGDGVWRFNKDGKTSRSMDDDSKDAKRYEERVEDLKVQVEFQMRQLPSSRRGQVPPHARGDAARKVVMMTDALSVGKPDFCNRPKHTSDGSGARVPLEERVRHDSRRHSGPVRRTPSWP